MCCIAGFIALICLASWAAGALGNGVVSRRAVAYPGVARRTDALGDLVHAPSGVLAIGAGFALRDLVQRRVGVNAALLAIVFGATVSAACHPSLTLALTLGVAFLR